MRREADNRSLGYDGDATFLGVQRPGPPAPSPTPETHTGRLGTTPPTIIQSNQSSSKATIEAKRASGMGGSGGSGGGGGRVRSGGAGGGGGRVRIGSMVGGGGELNEHVCACAHEGCGEACDGVLAALHDVGPVLSRRAGQH